MYLQPPLRDSQSDPAAAFCSRCGQEIYAGESLYHHADTSPTGSCLCPDCFRDWVLRWLDASPEGLAQVLGVDVERTSMTNISSRKDDVL